MGFRPNVPLPSGVEIKPYYDIRELTGAETKEHELFKPNPSGVDEDNNYRSNPLPGQKNHVVLAISIMLNKPFLYNAVEDSVDVFKVANQLKDAVLTINTEGGRFEAIKQNVEDYFNFSGVQGSVANYNDTGEKSRDLIIMPSTPPRPLPNLFAIESQESFTSKIKFATKGFPAASDYSDGLALRVGLKLWTAEMTNAQLSEYQSRLAAIGQG